jgi:TolB protein
MRAITIIMIIILLVAVVSLGFVILKYILPEPDLEEKTAEPEQNDSIAQDDTEIPDSEEEPQEKPEEDEVTVIEIYLDGDRQTGTFLGEAVYGMTSQEAFNIYGEEFSETGYLFAPDNTSYTFEPGSSHYVYIYALIPKYGWDYTRKKVLVAGEEESDSSINLSIDDPSNNETIKEDNISNIRVSGWSVDSSYKDSPGIESVEIYLNGPRGSGRFLGEADYGIERQDVAAAFANTNYTNSGYSLDFDGSELEPCRQNTLYIYSFSSSGNYNLGMRDFTIEGECKESNTIISADAVLDNQSIEISGWAINKDDITGGKPRDPNIEYSVKKIVFTSSVSGNEDIYIMNIDGTGLTQLTDSPKNDKYPAVSPDGQKIAYTSDINGIWQIMVMDYDGEEKEQLTNNPQRSAYPAWSFDGRYIFFDLSIEGEYEIYRMDSDGSNMTRLTLNLNINDWHPYGHPFQYKVIYEAGHSRHEGLYMMDYDGKNIKKITDLDMRQRTPAVSIDGETIVFSDNSSIYTMDIDGGNLKKISGDLEHCRHPDISPDNKYISFEGDVNGQLEIFIVNVDGSNLQRLTDIPGDDYDPYFLYQASQPF